MLETATLGSLSFSQNGWKEVPLWAHALITLGASFTKFDTPHRRLVIGLALPTRAYAATFTALGFALERAKLPVDLPAPDEHFRMLCALSPGSAVKYRDIQDNKVRDALIVGHKETVYSPVIGIKKNSGHRIDWLPPQQATRVQPSSKVIAQLPRSPKGKSFDVGSAFLRACAADLNAVGYCLQSRLECLFIGNKDMLTQELTETPFAVRSENFSRGTLQDILRVQELLPEGEGYRARILSDRGKQVSKTKETPKLVLFDGAAGFLKWRDLWRDAHWLVVLDKAQNGFDEAVAALNREYRDNHLEGDPPSLPSLPHHLNVIAYEEARA